MSKKNALNLFFILAIFSIDRITKIWAIKTLSLSQNLDVIFLPFLDFKLIWNHGIAFGLFSFTEKSYYNFLTFIILIVTIIVLWMIVKSKKLERYGFIMIFGGSMGNIFDRFYYSAVPDFIDIHYHNFHWFIFNVADIFITLGIIVIMFNEIFLGKKIK